MLFAIARLSGTLDIAAGFSRCYRDAVGKFSAGQRYVWLTVYTLVLAFVTAQPAQSQALSKPDQATDRALRRLHDILRQPPGPNDAARHDAYISLIGIANEDTLPLLLERLRIDYGSTEPVLPPGVKAGFVCTQVHLVDALRSITNTDQGMFYPRWEAWWEGNRHVPRLQWVLNGFREDGLHVVEPPDERFGLELIQTLAAKRQYYAVNARRLLLRVSARERAPWVISAANSDQRLLRLGALSDIEQIDSHGHEDIVRKLAADTDPEIRDLAVTALKRVVVPSRR